MDDRDDKDEAKEEFRLMSQINADSLKLVSSHSLTAENNEKEGDSQSLSSLSKEKEQDDSHDLNIRDTKFFERY